MSYDSDKRWLDARGLRMVLVDDGSHFGLFTVRTPAGEVVGSGATYSAAARAARANQRKRGR